MKIGAALTGIALLLCSQISSAEIYRHTDEQGQTVYSDSPREGGNPVELPAINTTPAVVPTASSPKSKPSRPAAAANTVRIQQPRNGQVFPNGRIPTQVSVSLQRPLYRGEKLRFSLDGKLVNEGRSPSTTIPLLTRGGHQIAVSVIDSQGRELSRDSVSITAHWPGK